MPQMVSKVFRGCAQAILNQKQITREGRSDKEFHFQNWFKDRLEEVSLEFEEPGRNTYPDIHLVDSSEGFELKALAHPGRWANYDCNSQVPFGEHDGRQIYYVFGRYPKNPDGNSYPVLDLVICHGSFLNADNTYEHRNESFSGFGSYGDILVRDRKMYVAPTPYALLEGTVGKRTLITPVDTKIDDDLTKVAEISRMETSAKIAKYSFDLKTNTLSTDDTTNPTAGKEHKFAAYRLPGDPDDPVSLRDPTSLEENDDLSVENEEE